MKIQKIKGLLIYIMIVITVLYTTGFEALIRPSISVLTHKVISNKNMLPSV